MLHTDYDYTITKLRDVTTVKTHHRGEMKSKHSFLATSGSAELVYLASDLSTHTHTILYSLACTQHSLQRESLINVMQYVFNTRPVFYTCCLEGRLFPKKVQRVL